MTSFNILSLNHRVPWDDEILPYVPWCAPLNSTFTQISLTLVYYKYLLDNCKG